MNKKTQADTAPSVSRGVEGFSDLFGGHFPGHTMQRVRTPDGKYLYSYVSPEVRSTFGLDPEALMQGDGVRHEWLHPDDRDRFVRALEKSAGKLSMLDEEVRVELPDGGFKWVRSIGHPRRLSDGTVIWDGVALDVTDRREAKEALERALAQTKRDEISEQRFAAIAARDVAVPFERLRTAVEALKRKPKPTARLTSEVVDAFEEFAASFKAARDLVRAGKLPEDETMLAGPEKQEAANSESKAVDRLTRRQREVLQLLQSGASNREIAEQLGIREGTVKLHVSTILRALGVKNRTMAAAVGAPSSDL